MKFAKSLLRNEIPEWSQFYIDYKGLKKLVRQAATELHAAGQDSNRDELASQNIETSTEGTNRSKIANGSGQSELGNSSANSREASAGPMGVDPAADDRITAPFFFAIDRNVEIVNNFYNSKFAEYSRRFRHVQQQVGLLWQQLNQDETEETEKEEMISMLLELRSHLRNLQWYAEVNKRGFTKILKKFDKKIGTHAKSYYLTSKILILGFSNGQEIADKVDEISKMLREIAPHFPNQEVSTNSLATTNALASANSLAHSLGSTPQSGFSQGNQLSPKNTSETSLISAFDQLRSAVENNDRKLVEEFLETTVLNSKQVLMLVLRSVAVHADSVIPLLAERHAVQLSNAAGDINRRNIIHKAVIAEGRKLVEENTSTKEMQIDVGVSASDHNQKAARSARNSRGEETTVSDQKSAQSISVLIHAVARRSPVSLLLLAVDLQLRTPLHYAVRYGLAGTVKLLLSLEPAALRFSDADAMTPLSLAVVNKQPITLAELLKYSPPKVPELLLTASRLDAPKVCEALIDQGKYDVNFRNSGGETALHLASKYNHLSTVKLLISRNADLEVRESTFEWTPLFVAAVDGSEEIAQVLLDSGARGDVLDQSGWSAKEHAALRGHLALAKKLPSPRTTTPEKKQSPPPLTTPPQQQHHNGKQTNSLEKRRTADNTVLKTFGHRYLQNEDECLILVTLGSKDLRKKSIPPVQLDTVPMSEAGKTQLDTALSLVVSATHSQSEVYPVDLPVSELGLATEPIPFLTKDFDNLQLIFDLVPTYSAGSNILARGVFFPNRINLMDDLKRSMHTIPIIEATSLRVLGKVNFEYLVVKPFSHPQNGLNVSTTYWRSLITTRVIGHRGLGKNTLEKSSLQLGENTVESFIQAANLGASYVEFDVQLTKDNVPVIYHDFLVGDSGFDIPMQAMTLDQFMNIQRPVRGRHERKSEEEDHQSVDTSSTPGDASSSAVPAVPSFPVDVKVKRSKSVYQFNSSDNIDINYDDAVRRMRYTRDFQTKGFKGNVRGLHIQSKFATLEELFRTLPKGLGFNIEFKYPMLDEAENEEMDGIVVEMNRFVDTILKVIYDNKRERDVILSSFNPDICIMLSLKQPSIPILFLTEAGTETMYDVRASSLQEAIRFARRFNLLGIVSGASPLIMCPRLVRAVKESGLVCFTYGTENNVPENARIQLKAGVDAVIVDSVLAIRKELTDVQADQEDDILAQELRNAIEKANINA